MPFIDLGEIAIRSESVKFIHIPRTSGRGPTVDGDKFQVPDLSYHDLVKLCNMPAFYKEPLPQ